MDFRILGPLELREGEREVLLGRGKQRALLALLLLHRDEAVSTDRIADETVDFITRHRDEPFLVHVSNYAVHTRLDAKPELINRRGR